MVVVEVWIVSKSIGYGKSRRVGRRKSGAWKAQGGVRVRSNRHISWRKWGPTPHTPGFLENRSLPKTGGSVPGFWYKVCGRTRTRSTQPARAYPLTITFLIYYLIHIIFQSSNFFLRIFLDQWAFLFIVCPFHLPWLIYPLSS